MSNLKNNKYICYYCKYIFFSIFFFTALPNNLHQKLLSFTACKNELFGIWQASKMNFCWFWECSNNTLVVFENDFKVSLFYNLTYFYYYLIYFYYYSWILLYFLVLFISFIVLFQLSFTFIYRIYSKKISVLTK